MSMLIPLLLLALAIACAVAYALARWWGVAVVAVLAIAGSVVFAMRSNNDLMAVAYIAAFAWPVFLGAGALGAGAGALMRRRNYGLVLLPLLPIAGFVAYQYDSQRAEHAEDAKARHFVADHAQLAQLTGGRKANLSVRTTFSRRESVGRYEFTLKAREPLYAVVQVERGWFTEPKFQLQCVTTVPTWKRQAGQSPCAEGVVALDDPQYALAPEKSRAEQRAEAKAQAAEKRAAEEHLAQQLAKVQAATSAGAATAPSAAAPSTAAPASAGPLAQAEVAVVGVYESARRVKGAPGTRDAGPVQVNVAAGSTPLVLVLSSYEPVQWQVTNRGRPIAAVLMSGYHSSTVTGVNAPITTIGTQYAYKADSAEWQRLQLLVARHAPKPPRHFLGAYAGSTFEVPGN